MSKAAILTVDEAASNGHKVRRAEAPLKNVPSLKGLDLQSDVWHLDHLLRSHERKCHGRINFADIPTWLRADAKEYVAHMIENTAPGMPRVSKVVVTLRYLGRLLPSFDGRPIDLRLKHAREAGRRLREIDSSPDYKHKIKSNINQFMAFVRQKHPEVQDNNFQIVLPRQNTKDPIYSRQGGIVDTEIQVRIIDACLSDLRKYREAKSTYIDTHKHHTEYMRRRRRRIRQYPPGEAPKLPRENLKVFLQRAILAQATILEICVGRRAAAVCGLPMDVKVEKGEWPNEAGQTERGVWVRFIENKVTLAYEDVFCPDAFGELALQAIITTKELTEDLRQDNPHLAQHLFLVPGHKHESVVTLSPGQMNYYLNGSITRSSYGLIQRYNIPGGRVTTGSFRRTRATKAWMGGMQVHEVAADLGHFKIDTTIRHYIVGDEESRRRYKTLMEHGALSGAMLNFAGGVEVVNVSLGRRHVEVMAAQGRAVVPNRYGYCALAGSGHCIRTTPCYIGETVESEGCDYHLLSPDALPALEEDRETLEAGIEVNNGDQWCGQLVQSMRNQLEVVNRKIKIATNLHKKLDAAGQDVAEGDS
jgi:hypothetical protein